ncbi:DUF2254 domain-containing protein [Halalkalibacillus sediminis]|uniref:DUF2254 domain-containing protein n=1 Tax=Halalkalibacillus sediminis TaxID=2018042 RepID=UPI001EE49F4E|nr:DUF2254 domain-containing protein [Halalkalibacillus sediminis]
MIPVSLKKYFNMSKRLRKKEIQSTLWFMPLLYILGALFLVAFTLYIDFAVGLREVAPEILQFEASVARTLVSVLVGGILTLSAFTLNSLLVVLTTFSGQFSPRMLLNFIADKNTQHALGIFNGSFVYVLVIFLFIGNAPFETLVAVPVMSILLAFITSIVFVYFINHASTWMQVHNITYSMKNISKDIIYSSLRKDLDQYRTTEPGDMMKEYKDNQYQVLSREVGYLQLVDYKTMIEEAKKDNIIVQIQPQVGDYLLTGNVLFTYWGPGADEIEDDTKYYRMFEFGHKETEVQDLQMGMHKLAEIAIKAVGNDDPKTATNTIHQMADLMITVDGYITFSPYLADDEDQVRVILQEETFDYYIYRGFGFIRHYAKDNHLIITDIMGALAMISESISENKYESIWEFAVNTMDHIEANLVYELDKRFLLRQVYRIAELTGHIEDYPRIESRFYPSANENV